MKKTRLIAFALTLTVLMTVCALPAFAASSASLLPQKRAYSASFTDTKGTWCDSYVKTCYEMGLLDGKTASRFDPSGTLTGAQILAVTARLHSLLNGGTGKFPAGAQGDAWYQPYADYLAALFSDESAQSDSDSLENAGYSAFYMTLYFPDDPCTRQEFVALLYSVVPQSALTAINAVTSLPDESFSLDDGSIRAFYNAGILTGTDEYGTFRGSDSLSRGQAAALLARLADPAQRIKFTPKTFSYAGTLLGLNPSDTVFTIDGFAVSADLYCYAALSQIMLQQLGNAFSYYETYADDYSDYLNLEDNNLYDSFADYLEKVRGIDVAAETAVKWNEPDKAGLTPAQKVTEDTLSALTQVAVLFSHAADYPITAAQRAQMQENSASAGELSIIYGFSDSLTSLMADIQLLSENITAKYLPSASALNDYLKQYQYFYGRYIGIGYDLDSASPYYERTKSEAQTLAETVRRQAANHSDDADYFGYLGWKYGDDGVAEPTLLSTDSLSGEDQATLNNLSVGQLSPILCQEETEAGTGMLYVYLKDDASGDEFVSSTIGSIPAQAQLSTWAQAAAVTQTDPSRKFDIAAMADKLTALPWYSVFNS